jgi:uncharacterized protein
MSVAPPRQALAFAAIADRLRETLRAHPLGELDGVVALARGGVVLGALAAYELGLPLQVLRLAYRDDTNRPMHPHPTHRGALPQVAGGRVLLVDDVSVSGATLRAARELLGCAALTLVAKGRPGAADLILFDDLPGCVDWPWQVPEGVGA